MRRFHTPHKEPNDVGITSGDYCRDGKRRGRLREQPFIRCAPTIYDYRGVNGARASQGQAADQRSDIWSFGVILYEVLNRPAIIDAYRIAASNADECATHTLAFLKEHKI